MALAGGTHRGEPLFRVGFWRRVTKGPRDRFSSSSQAELREDATDVVLDRFGTDEEALADGEV